MSEDADLCCEVAARIVKKMRAVKDHQRLYAGREHLAPLELFADKRLQISKWIDMFWHYISNVQPGSDPHGTSTMLAFENLLDPVLSEILSVPEPPASTGLVSHTPGR